MSRTALFGLLVVFVSAGALIVAFAVGAPHPGANERAFFALCGLVGVSIGITWVHTAVRTDPFAKKPVDEFSTFRALLTIIEEERAVHPVAAATRDTTVSIQLGQSTIGDYKRFLEPRLVALAEARLLRLGIDPDDRAWSSFVLGPAYFLVDPQRPRVTDGLAPGMPTAAVADLVAALENLP